MSRGAHETREKTPKAYYEFPFMYFAFLVAENASPEFALLTYE